jgi:transposase
MGWTGRAPAPEGTQSAPGGLSGEGAPSCLARPAFTTTIGMDMGKNTLHMIGLDSRGAIVLREKVSNLYCNIHVPRGLG